MRALRKDDDTAGRGKVTMSSNYSSGDGGGYGEGRVPGARRKKLAGYLKAANDIRQSYTQSYTERFAGSSEFDNDGSTIPGSFPDVAIVTHGDEQLVMFPSYARRHIKEPPNPDGQKRDGNISDEGPGDAEYWAREWQKFEDDRAIVDVDVRGWIYSPHRGPMTRKNRLLIGLARQLSGIPAPKGETKENSQEPLNLMARHKEHEARRDEERIAEEAEQILRRGDSEEQAASQGRYSENPKNDPDNDSIYGEGSRSGSHTPSRYDEPPGPGHLKKRESWNQPSDMSPAELLQANSHLMARLRPFLTNPLVSTAITVFFYDEKTSVSRTVMTNEAGHFNLRAPLEFVPTHVRVLASEGLSATEEVKITEPKGVSLISDVDDTIKHSSIGSGAREIFRNAFIRDLADLTIDGVKEWYNTMYDMGVGVHYVSNSPWQLFPVLVSFFQKAGLPPGSYHLKQYSGMLQGIFEPVAERKKGTLERIMRDFPERKFILIGDSGEADLEVYTDVVLANPGKILAIFIRDVTTPESQGFFDSAMGPLSGGRWNARDNLLRHSGDSRTASPPGHDDSPERRPILPPRAQSEVKPQTSDGPVMGKLIDFDDEPEQVSVHESHRQVMPRSNSTFADLESPRRRSAPIESVETKGPPPRPTKPMALRGTSTGSPSESPAPTSRGLPPPPPKPRRQGNSLNQQGTESPPHPLSQAQSSSDLKSPTGQEQGYISSARQKVSAAYNSLPEVRSYIPGRQESTSTQPLPSLSSSQQSQSQKPTPPPRRGAANTSNSSVPGSGVASAITKRMSWASADSSDDESSYAGVNSNPNVPVNKKLDLWKRRWKRAKGILDSQNVVLRAWRTGDDVCLEAVRIVEKEMKAMGVEGYGRDSKGDKNGKGKTGEGGGEVKVKDLKR